MKLIETPSSKHQDGHPLQDVALPVLYRDLFPYAQAPRIAFDGKSVPMNPPRDIWITDTTFRDGQQARPPYTVEQIATLYGMLHRLGGAKGGIALAIAGELKLPVKLIGIGEALEDLRPFDADDFATKHCVGPIRALIARAVHADPVPGDAVPAKPVHADAVHTDPIQAVDGVGRGGAQTGNRYGGDSGEGQGLQHGRIP